MKDFDPAARAARHADRIRAYEATITRRALVELREHVHGLLARAKASVSDLTREQVAIALEYGTGRLRLVIDVAGEDLVATAQIVDERGRASAFCEFRLTNEES